MDLQKDVGPGKFKAPLWVWIAGAGGLVIWHFMGQAPGVPQKPEKAQRGAKQSPSGKTGHRGRGGRGGGFTPGA